MKYYIGLDNGGTTIKACLFNEYGQDIAVSSTDTITESVHPDFAEQDMDKMWEANCKVLKELLRVSNVNPDDIRCITVCGHGKGLYLWGQDDKPVRKGICSTDNRAYNYPILWEKNGVAEKVFQISCQHIMACQPVSLLAWLQDNEPEAIHNIKWIFSCKDYIRFKLTGKAFGEYSDYSGSNLLNLHTKQYDTEPLKLFGLESLYNALPPLKCATDICGYITNEVSALTGLPEGIPVAGGLFDINACGLAVGLTDPTNICMIAGTWSINEYLSPKPILDGTAWMNSLFAIPEYYLIEECSPTSAGNMDWILKNLFPELFIEKNKKDVYEYINKCISNIDTNIFSPIFLPFILGSNAHPNAKGCFIGISKYHKRDYLLRSVYEGVCFSHKYHLDKLLKTRRNSPPKTIRLSGGVVNSKVWLQMFADIMQFPIEVISAAETGALGCAICGAVACGDKNTIQEAITDMANVSEVYYPNPENISIYKNKYAIYLKAIEKLDSLWNDITNITNLSAKKE